VPAWADERILDLTGSWELVPEPELHYEIDAECDTLAQEGGTIMLECPAGEGMTDEIVLTLGADPGVSLETLPATVHLRYETHDASAAFGNPEIAGHAFVLSDGDELIAAGVLARSELSRWGALEAFSAAVGWEDAPVGCAPRFDVPDACYGWQPLDMKLSIGESSGIVRSGESASVGAYDVRIGLVERSVFDVNSIDEDADGGEGCGDFELHHALVVRAP